MNGTEILVDTNILLYLLNGDDTIAAWLHRKRVFVSFITELELLSFPGIRVRDELQIKSVLKACEIIPLTSSIRENFISLRRKYNLKLPDALIAATAVDLVLPFMTADKQFKRVTETEVIIYEVG